MLETVEGRGLSPYLVLWYVRGLPDTSLTTALMRGGREHHGWGADRHLAAAIHDQVQWNNHLTGAPYWGKDGPEFVPFPVPGREVEEKKEKEPVTVAALWARMKKAR